MLEMNEFLFIFYNCFLFWRLFFALFFFLIWQISFFFSNDFPSSVLPVPVKQFEDWLQTLKPPVTLAQAARWKESTIENGLEKAGIDEF